MSKIELISVYGNDATVCDAARVSFDKKASNYSEEQNSRLINYLVKHKHTSVFRHPQLTFRINCPIYVERQLRKHEIGLELGLPPEPNSSINSISGRYVDFSDTYTLIKEWRTQSKDSKQGSADPLDFYGQSACDEIEYAVKEFCQNAYKKLIDLGVSKEQARTILPLNLNTTFLWTGSLLSFIHVFNLRLKADAQQETREVVAEMLRLLKENGNFAESLKAFEL
jgi:thymidylate synthase (FAD)